MSVWAITMVRNEEDVIEAVVEHLLAEGVDYVLVADNLSTDATPELLAEMATKWPVTVVPDPDPVHRQAEKMNRLARLAAERGAEWVIPFDADELWLSVDGCRLADTLRASADADVLVAPWFDRLPRLRGRRPVYGGAPMRMARPHVLSKVAFRPLHAVELEQGNHDVSGPALRRVHGRIVVHHWRWRSFRHFVAKSRQGKAAMDAGGDELRAEWAAHWRRYGGRSRVHLLLTYLNLIRVAHREGVVFDPVEPSKL